MYNGVGYKNIGFLHFEGNNDVGSKIIFADRPRVLHDSGGTASTEVPPASSRTSKQIIVESNREKREGREELVMGLGCTRLTKQASSELQRKFEDVPLDPLLNSILNDENGIITVSYTHLTLPTTSRV